MKTDKIVKIKTRKEGDRLTSDLILVHTGGYDRYKIGGVPKGQEGRKEHGGPMVAGPWHFIFGLASVIAANPEHGTWGEMKRARAANLIIEVSDGDLLKIDGLLYTVNKTFNGVLDLVEGKRSPKKA